MFVSPENLFTESFPDCAAFALESADMKFSQFAAEVKKRAAFFERLEDGDFILRAEGGIVNFAVLFFAMLQAKKRVMLPSSEKMAADFSAKTDVKIVSDQKGVAGAVELPNEFPEAPDFKFRNMRGERVCFFTSGSTSAPKMIEKSFATLSDETQNCANVMGRFDDCLIASTCEPFHLYGMLWRLLYPLATQMPIHSATIRAPEALIAIQRRALRAIFITTPSFIEAVARHRELFSFPQNIAAIITSGGLLKNSASRSANEIWGKYPTEIFGSTECGGIASRNQGVSQNWKVFDGVEISTDSRGCLAAKSPYCAGGSFQTNDLVKILPGREFSFGGRIDRIVKIGETQLSLPDLENAALESEFVESCHADFAENVLRALIVPNKIGRNFLMKNGRAKLLESINSALKKDFDGKFMLRKIRPVNQIPMNAQGKILKSEVEKIFASKMEEPIFLSESFCGDSFEIEMFFGEENTYFKGHFPVAKILPGAIQLHFAAVYISKILGASGSVKCVKRLKYTNVIRPNQPVLLRAKKDSSGSFTFTFLKNGAACSSGTLEFENA